MNNKVINAEISAEELKNYLNNGLVSVERSGAGISLKFESDKPEPNNDADLVSFGNYLLSKERRKSIQLEDGIRGIVNHSVVYDTDLENWKLKNNP